MSHLDLPGAYVVGEPYAWADPADAWCPFCGLVLDADTPGLCDSCAADQRDATDLYDPDP